MTAEPSPRPWQVRYGDTVADATGAKVAACWQPKNVALIVNAVNIYDHQFDRYMQALRAERDRLRAIVRRIETEMERCHRRDGGISQELMDAVYEASAAIEEKKK